MQRSTNWFAATLACMLTLNTSQAGPVMWEGDRSANALNFIDSSDNVRGRFYLAAFGGANLFQTPNELEPSVQTYGPGGTRFENQNQFGWMAGIKAGYVWFTGIGLEPALELESFYGSVPYRGEHGYKRLDPKSREWLAKKDIFYPQYADGTELDARTGGHITSYHLMANFVLRAQMGKFRPYVGVGGGAAKVEQHGLWMKLEQGKTVLLPKDGGIVPAVQGIVGLEYLFANNWGLFAEYKALAHLNQQNFADLYIQHLLAMGLRFYF